jgi:hypothetical protein
MKHGSVVITTQPFTKFALIRQNKYLIDSKLFTVMFRGEV